MRSMSCVVLLIALVCAQRQEVNISIISIGKEVPFLASIMSETSAGYLMAVRDANSLSHLTTINKTHFNISSFSIHGPGISDPHMKVVTQLSAMESNPVAIMGPHPLEDALTCSHASGESLIPQITQSVGEMAQYGTRQNFYTTVATSSDRVEAVLDTLISQGFGSVGYIYALTDTGQAYLKPFLASAARKGFNVPVLIGFDTSDASQFRVSLATARDVHIRAFFVQAKPSDNEISFVFQTLSELEMLSEGFVYATSLGQVPATSAWGRMGNVIGVVEAAADTSTPFALDVDARLRASDLHAEFPTLVTSDYDYATNGMTGFFISAYESAALLLQAADNVVRRGMDPYDHNALLDEMEVVEMNLIHQSVRFTNNRAHRSLNVVQALPACGEGVTVRCGLVEVGTWTSAGGFVPAANTTITYLGNTTTPPANWLVDTCGRLQRRLINGSCLACPRNHYNRQGDGAEECELCALGSELVSGECRPCAENERGRIDSDGVPRCSAKPQSVDLVPVYIVLGFLGTMIIVVYVHVRVKQYVRRISKQKEAALKHAEDEKKFLAFLFHELRNPLNGVCGYLQFLTQNFHKLVSSTHAPDSDAVPQAVRSAIVKECEGDLEMICRCVDQTMDILHTVLEMRRVLSTGRLNIARVNLRELADEVATVVGRAGHSVDMDFRIVQQEVAGEQSNDSPCINSDGARLRSVLVNILLHSLEHTSHGRILTTITLSDARNDFKLKTVPSSRSITPSLGSLQSESSPERVQKRSVADTVLCAVEIVHFDSQLDTRHLKAIFDVYSYASRSSSGQSGQHSLGLALSQYYVNLLGGEITVTCPPTENCTKYSFEFPTSLHIAPPTQCWANRTTLSRSQLPAIEMVQIHPGENSQSRDMMTQGVVQTDRSNPKESIGDGPAPHVPSPSIAGKRILVVDDVALNRKLLVRKLKSPPFALIPRLEIVEAVSGEECLDLHVTHAFDIIFMDERMDGILGSEAAKIIRQRERESGAAPCCIIACTGNATAEDETHFLSCGMQGLIAKPLPAPAQLLERLEILLQRAWK